jgi:hypothetical protein
MHPETVLIIHLFRFVIRYFKTDPLQTTIPVSKDDDANLLLPLLHQL